MECIRYMKDATDWYQDGDNNKYEIQKQNHASPNIADERQLDHRVHPIGYHQ